SKSSSSAPPPPTEPLMPASLRLDDAVASDSSVPAQLDRAASVLRYPTPEENPLIQSKLQQPLKVLTVEESISLLTQCIQYGKAQSSKASDKDILIFIGNTGAGKSTLANFLAGCTMVSKNPKDLGLKALKKVIVVQPT